MKTNTLGWYVNRISRMSPAEIAARVVSLARDATDAVRAKSGALPQPSGPLPAPAFRIVTLSSAEYSKMLSEKEQSQLKEQADALCRNELNIFGVPRALGEPVQWHRDHHQKLEVPVKLSFQTDYRLAKVFGDCKEVWEPNRHHQLVVLGRAWHAFGDHRYARKVVELLRSWMDANPYGYGMNWRSPLELGIRIINWVWALDLISTAEVLTEADGERLHKFAYLHCWELSRKFSYGSSANNHLIGEAAGLHIAASYWFADSHPEWVNASAAVLQQEIVAQQFASGCTKEQALSYQFFVAQFYITCGLVAEWSQRPFPGDFWQSLGNYLSFLGRFRGFGEALPFFGDQDDGYVLDLGHGTHDVAAYLHWAEALAGCEKSFAPAALMLHGRPLDVLPQVTVSETPVASLHEDAGYFLLEDPQCRSMALLFDAGQLGYGSMAAHGHADALHIALSLEGKPFLVDSGTYDYFTYPDLRNHFRSTAAHNTVRLNGVDQSEMAGPFMWKRAADAKFLAPDLESDGSGSIVGELSTYPTLDLDQVCYRRRVSWNAERTTLRLADTLAASEKVAAELFFHFHPDVVLEEQEHGRFLARNGGLALEFRFACPADSQLTLHRTGPLCAYSNQYHQLSEGACLCVSLKPATGFSLALEISRC